MISIIIALAITLPTDTTVFEGKNSEMANAFCLGCHSADYVTTQPPGMTYDFWHGLILKMQKTYGAPIPEEKVDELTKFFFERR